MLFEATQLGRMQLNNRIVMAPMTRSRAIGNLANDLMVEYYGQRAEAGLIITEGVSPSPNGLGYARIPGLFHKDQVPGWRKITDAVHAKGGKIFMQLMHTGRVSSVVNLPKGAEVVAPSSVALSGKVWTDEQGEQPYSVPKEMSLEDIQKTKMEYVNSAKLAIEAGLDGVELHAANGYLLEQFLNPRSNKRTDAYGGSDQGRMKFVLEVAQAVAEAIGGDRTGIRISPYGVFNEMGAFESIDLFYAELSKKLSAFGLVYIHIVDHSAGGAPPVSQDVKRLIRDNFKGKYILSGGYNVARAEEDLKSGKGDLVSFGKPFLGNPNLVEKLKTGKSLNPPDVATLYTPGAKGYTDFES